MKLRDETERPLALQLDGEPLPREYVRLLFHARRRVAEAPRVASRALLRAWSAALALIIPDSDGDETLDRARWLAEMVHSVEPTSERVEALARWGSSVGWRYAAAATGCSLRSLHQALRAWKAGAVHPEAESTLRWTVFVCDAGGLITTMEGGS